MLQNQAWVKEPFKVQDKWADFNVTECGKFTDTVSDSILQLTLKNPSLLESLDFVSKKNVYDYLKRLLKNSSPFQLHLLVKLTFLYKIL